MEQRLDIIVSSTTMSSDIFLKAVAHLSIVRTKVWGEDVQVPMKKLLDLFSSKSCLIIESAVTELLPSFEKSRYMKAKIILI